MECGRLQVHPASSPLMPRLQQWQLQLLPPFMQPRTPLACPLMCVGRPWPVWQQQQQQQWQQALQGSARPRLLLQWQHRVVAQQLHSGPLQPPLLPPLPRAPLHLPWTLRLMLQPLLLQPLAVTAVPPAPVAWAFWPPLRPFSLALALQHWAGQQQQLRRSRRALPPPHPTCPSSPLPSPRLLFLLHPCPPLPPRTLLLLPLRSPCTPSMSSGQRPPCATLRPPHGPSMPPWGQQGAFWPPCGAPKPPHWGGGQRQQQGREWLLPRLSCARAAALTLLHPCPCTLTWSTSRRTMRTLCIPCMAVQRRSSRRSHWPLPQRTAP